MFRFEGLGDKEEELIGDEADEERDGDDANGFGMLLRHLLILCFSEWLFEEEEVEEFELELRLLEPCSFDSLPLLLLCFLFI